MLCHAFVNLDVRLFEGMIVPTQGNDDENESDLNLRKLDMDDGCTAVEIAL